MLDIGIFKSVPPDVYHNDPCPQPSLSCSIAKVLLNQSPAHAWAAHPRMNPLYRHDDSTRTDLGTVAHDVLLQGGTDNVVVLDPAEFPSKTGSIPDGYTNANIRKARDNVRALGKIPILKPVHDQVMGMVAVARNFVQGSDLDGCFGADWDAETTVIWQANGCYMRSRLDRYSSSARIIMDYKTTGNANPDYLTRRVILDGGYDVQAAFYRRAIDFHVGELLSFLFLFQEIEPPYLCSIVGLEPALQELGEMKVDHATALWAANMKSGQWPGYSKRTHWAIAPAWALAQLEAGRV